MMGFSSRGLLAAAAVLIVVVVCVRLGFWQLDRLAQRRALNAEIQAAIQRQPLVLDAGGFAEILEDPQGNVYRRASATGTFDDAGEIVLRGRSHGGRPGVHLVAPLRLHHGGSILVNRGWVPSPDAATADPRPYRRPGEQRITGLLQLLPENPDDASPLPISVEDTTVFTLRRLSHGLLSSAAERPLPRLYLQLLPEPGDTRPLPAPVPPPTLDEGSHFGYAIQWFSFAAIAIVGFAIVALRRTRPLESRRR